MEKGRTPSIVELFDKVYARSDGNSSSVVVNEILLQIAAQKDIPADIESPRYTSAASNNVTRSYTKTTTFREGRNVMMMSMVDMKKNVAKGVLFSDDPKSVVGGLPDEDYGEICIFMANIKVYDDQEQVGSKNIARNMKNEAISVVFSNFQIHYFELGCVLYMYGFPVKSASQQYIIR
ncbi:hypothetical protein OROMI_006349 [Orobanche minor]